MTNDIIKRLGYIDKIFINLVFTVRSRQKSISFPERSDSNLKPTFYVKIMKKNCDIQASNTFRTST